jgi:aminotransferase EvaB
VDIKMNMPPIPVWSYELEYRQLRDGILAACDRVFASGRLVLGEENTTFEKKMAAYVGVEGAVGVNSGTDAIYIALLALGVKAGDEVITVPNTAVPTVSAIETMGARPVFVDVDDNFLMDVAKLEAAITPRTRAIIPVHLYGQCVDMDPLLAIAEMHRLKVLEDVAQAQGARYRGRQAGSMGHAATYSFYPTKVLGAYGDGGMILSRDTDVLTLARSLRFYGMEKTYYSERHGYNSRLDEVQAAILSEKIVHIEDWIARRRAIAARYAEGLRGSAVRAPVECDGGRHVYHLYVVEHADRDGVIERMAKAGITCTVAYRWPIHVQRGFAHLGYGVGDFPVAEAKAQRIFSLPMFPQLTDAQVERVIATLREVA